MKKLKKYVIVSLFFSSTLALDCQKSNLDIIFVNGIGVKNKPISVPDIIKSVVVGYSKNEKKGFQLLHPVGEEKNLSFDFIHNVSRSPDNLSSLTTFF